MKAEEIDLKFDNDEEVLEQFDLSTLKRPGLEKSLIEIDFPQWMLNALEQEAMLLGVDRNAVIKFWIAERLREITSQLFSSIPAWPVLGVGSDRFCITSAIVFCGEEAIVIGIQAEAIVLLDGERCFALNRFCSGIVTWGDRATI